MTDRRAGKWPWLPDLGCLLLLAAPLAVLFAPAIGGDRALAMRDGSHYYVPLWQWVDQQWRAGRWPLWNPHEQGGVALDSDPTVALWYPGRIAMALLGRRFFASYHAFLALHWACAAWGVFRAARRGGASRAASTVAGFAYGYGAPVLFLYSNPIYLVGAAWLPWCWSGVAQLLRRPSGRAIVSLAIPLALLVLGGDPQMAYHVGIVALIGAFGSARRATAAERTSWLGAFDWRAVGRRVVALLAAAALAAALSAIQIVPTWQALDATPRWTDADRTSPSPWDRPAADTHDELRYHFSVGPWRWPETFVPNFAGRMFPRHARWMSAVPAEGRVWSPSLYLGTIPVVLALAAMRRRRASRTPGELNDAYWNDFERETRWLTRATWLAIFAACGWFGFGWLLQELRFWLVGANRSEDALARLGPQVGGPYWAMVHLLPGYELFRYPAKWWTVAACGVALLAARGWDEWFHFPQSRIAVRARRLATVLTILVVVGLLVLAVGTASGWRERAASLVAADPWLGPFDARLAESTLWRAALQTLVSCALLLGLSWARRRMTPRWANVCGGIVLAWIAIDLVHSNQWMLNWLPESSLAIQEPAGLDGAPAGRVYRPATAGNFPRQWAVESSDRRLIETHELERSGRYGKLPLLRSESVLSHDDAWGGAEWRELLDFTARHGAPASQGVRVPPDAILDLLSVTERVDSPGIRRPTAFPRAWLAGRVVAVVGRPSFGGQPEEESESHAKSTTHPTKQDQRFARLLRPDGKWRDLRNEAVIEVDASYPNARDATAWLNSLAEPGDRSARAADDVHRTPLPCPVVLAEPCRMELRVTTDGSALLVVNEAWAPGWRAWIRDPRSGVATSSPIWRVNGVLRGVVVPPGDWHVELQYEAPGLRWSAVATIAAWTSLVVAWLLGRKTRRAAA